MSQKSKMSLKSDQRGVVSIVVAVILMMIMSLIVLAMAENTQREQRQSLDRQLSDQAFYNAETGINDAANYLYQNPLADVDRTNCDNPPPQLSGNIDDGVTGNGNDGTNKYTCLLYDKAPKSVVYDNISISTPRVIPINPVDQSGTNPVELANLTISWDDAKNRDGDISGACSFSEPPPAPQLPNNCGYGGLRFELFSPAPSRQEIQERAYIAFLLPNANSGNDLSLIDAIYPNTQGIISAADCSGGMTLRRCYKTFTDINRGNMFLSLRSLYRPVNITITGTDTSGNEVRFANTQIMVDSTGKASDVLRRLQVRLPAQSQYTFPGFALQTKDSICKVLDVTRNSNGTGSVASANPSPDECPIN